MQYVDLPRLEHRLSLSPGMDDIIQMIPKKDSFCPLLMCCINFITLNNIIRPLVAGEQYQPLKQILSKHLPIVLPKKARIPWKQLKEIPKSERKLFREQNQSTCPNENTLGAREGLIFGVNDVTKAIEKRSVKSILITDDVQPKLIVEHLIDQSVLQRIPVLVVPGLRGILRNVCRLSSIVIAFTGDIKYQNIQQTIENIHSNYPVPQTHINFERSLEFLNSSVIHIEDSIMKDSPVCETSTCSVVEIEPKIVYLYRQAKDKRVFIPKKSNNQPKYNSEMEGDIYFPVDFSLAAAKRNINVRKKYQSLKIKRVKGDINRNKRKIEEMKQKSNKKTAKHWKNNKVVTLT